MNHYENYEREVKRQDKKFKRLLLCNRITSSEYACLLQGTSVVLNGHYHTISSKWGVNHLGRYLY